MHWRLSVGQLFLIMSNALEGDPPHPLTSNLYDLCKQLRGAFL